MGKMVKFFVPQIRLFLQAGKTGKKEQILSFCV